MWCCNSPEAGTNSLGATTTLQGISVAEFELGRQTFKEQVAALLQVAPTGVEIVEVRELMRRAAGVEVDYEVCCWATMEEVDAAVLKLQDSNAELMANLKENDPAFENLSGVSTTAYNNFLKDNAGIIAGAVIGALVGVCCCLAIAYKLLCGSKAPQASPPAGSRSTDIYTGLGSRGLSSLTLSDAHCGWNRSGLDPDCYGNYSPSHPIQQIKMSFKWKDQGWGNRKGTCDLKLKGPGGVIKAELRNVAGLCEHSFSTPTVTLGRLDPIVNLFTPGDTVLCWFQLERVFFRQPLKSVPPAQA